MLSPPSRNQRWLFGRDAYRPPDEPIRTAEYDVAELPDDTELAEEEDAMVDIEQAMDVRDALGSMDRTCREMLDRFFARDETYRTIADELDVPMGTVASRISRCLDNLRQRLEGRNLAPYGSGG